MIAVVSSISVFILSSSTFFIMGCVLGWFCHKHKQSMAGGGTSDEAATPKPVPLYETVLQESKSGESKKGFEMDENVAYTQSIRT